MKYFAKLLRRWGAKIGISITDQSVFSGTNFFLNVLLIRWLTPDDYGIFAIALSIFLFLAAFQHAFVLDPVSIIGAAHYKDNFKKYVSIAVWIHCAITISISVIFGAAFLYLLAKKNVFAYPILGLAIASPLILFLYLFRQLCYLQEKPHLALWGSCAYLFFLFGGMLIIYKLNWISVATVLFLMGLASIGAVITFWRYTGVEIHDFYWSNIKDMVKGVIAEHWNYGKWMMGSAFASWLSICIYVPLIGLFAGVAQAGAFKAMQNLMLPLQKIRVALSSLFLPWFSKQRLARGAGYLKIALYKMLSSILLLSLVYIIFVIIYKDFIVSILYGKDYYITFTWIIPYLCAATFIGSIAHSFYLGLKVLKRSDANFWAQIAGVMVTLTIGTWLVYGFRLYGAAVASILTILTITAALIRFFNKFIGKSYNSQSVK